MARPRKNGRIYWVNGRARGNFQDLGGGREALVPEGEKLATKDPDIAAHLAAERVKELEQGRRNKILLGVERQSGLAPYAQYHLEQKAKEPGKKSNMPVSNAWLTQAEKHLRAAVDFFGPDRDLASINPEDLDRWVDHLRKQSNGRGGFLNEGSCRKYLNSLSNLFTRAASQGYITSNPVAKMFSRPVGEVVEAEFLNAHEAALLLESARTYRAPVDDGAFPYMYALIATFLLTGGRKSEVFGIEVDDVNLRHEKIHFRPNDWRRLKTSRSKRPVPLWPQLREILSEYLMERERTGGLGTLLFPSSRGTAEKMIGDVRKALDHIGRRAGFPKGYIRLHMLRHTYTAARLQTCDRGRPVAVYTVARELGHTGTDMLEDRYGHLHERTEDGDTEVVEFRVESHKAALKDKLAALQTEG